MATEGEVTIESQFLLFSKMFDESRSGATITLYRSDYWMRQADILDDRNLTVTDTGLLFFKLSKTELTFDEWSEMVSELCAQKNLDEEVVLKRLANCGVPGERIPKDREFRSYFKTYVSKSTVAHIGNE